MENFTVNQIADEFGHDSLDDCLVKAIESLEVLHENGIDSAILHSMRQRVQALYVSAIMQIMAA